MSAVFFPHSAVRALVFWSHAPTFGQARYLVASTSLKLAETPPPYVQAAQFDLPLRGPARPHAVRGACPAYAGAGLSLFVN
jgi:hypothetical protein